jgi:hypothetical protein
MEFCRIDPWMNGSEGSSFGDVAGFRTSMTVELMTVAAGTDIMIFLIAEKFGEKFGVFFSKHC